MTDFAAARANMVDGQVRTNNVTDLRVIAAMREVPRERFLPPARAGIAYLDIDTPLAGARCLMKPMVLARLLQAADLKPGDRVLDVASATGYGAALLGRIVSDVTALEIDAALVQVGKAALPANVTVVSGPLNAGWAQGAPYDAIVVEGASEIAPHNLCQQLKDGGRLVCVLGSGPGAKAMLYQRSGNDIGDRAVFDATASLLPGFAKTPVFAF
jgi:protein-L-isoaspartate(D-aspartate) O-methyltransferase